jgi:hypothetical protein
VDALADTPARKDLVVELEGDEVKPPGEDPGA